MLIRIKESKEMKKTQRVYMIVKALFPLEEIEYSTKKDAISVDSIYDENPRVIADRIIKILDIGVSEKVLSSIKDA